jgi:hypothetical protein
VYPIFPNYSQAFAWSAVLIAFKKASGTRKAPGAFLFDPIF